MSGAELPEGCVACLILAVERQEQALIDIKAKHDLVDITCLQAGIAQIPAYQAFVLLQ